MKRTDLERAWPATEPPPDFSERVLERLQLRPASVEPAARPIEPLPLLRRQRVRWLALPAVALALGAAMLLWPAGREREILVVAAEPRVLPIGHRAVAEVSAGARLRWSGEESPHSVKQERGAVNYRVEPGAAFRVQTPHGSVTAMGTEFRVVVGDRETGKEEPMKKRWAIAGAAGAMGALLWVSVDEGRVRLSSSDRELVLGAGQAASVQADGIVRRESAPQAASAAKSSAAPDAKRALKRQLADSVRRRAAQLRAAALAAKRAEESPASASPAAPPGPAVPAEQHTFGPSPSGASDPPTDPEQIRRREYINRTVHEQYFPVARDCYAELLERQPNAEGKVVLEFAIVGTADAGVVDRVAIREDEDAIEDPEFQLCMRESLYTAVFEPPPPGAEETTVVFPVMLRPD